MILDGKSAHCVSGYWPVSDRVILVKIEGKPFNIASIQVFTLTTDCTDIYIDKFYKDLDSERHTCKSKDINAKEGKGWEDIIVGPYGLGVQNEKGEWFVSCCEANDKIITNTWFENHPGRLAIWRKYGQPNQKLDRLHHDK